MLTLLTFPASFGQPSHSPYCVKAMGLLELAGEEWQAEYLDNPTKMPLGKLPVLRDGDKMIPDSANIQAYLEARGADFFPGLDKYQRAQAFAFMHLAEEELHLHLVYNRWIVDDNWTVVRDVFFAAIPRLLRIPVTNRLRKSVASGLNSQGFSRFSHADRHARLERALDAFDGQLGGKPFLFGERPCAADVSVVPVIGMLATLPTENEARRSVCARSDLLDYAARCQEAFYPDTKPTLNAAA